MPQPPDHQSPVTAHMTAPSPGQDKVLRFRALFMEEASELLLEAEQCLQSCLERPQDDAAGILFRSVHTIKGGAASFGMQRTIAFATVMESALEELRRGSYQLDAIRRHMFLRGFDMLASLLQAETESISLPEDAEAELVKTIQGLITLSIGLRTDTVRPAVSLPKLGENPDAAATIRIELAKIDRLVGLTGELTILETGLRRQADAVLAGTKASAEADGLVRSLDQLNAYLRELYDATMQTRAQPLGNVFQQLPRLVRNLASTLNKRVEIEIGGSDLEVDKSIIEILSAPLAHILRNAVDHGIEAVDARIQAGKPRDGLISIDARCVDNRLLIKIEDDGRGIDTDKLSAKASALGIMQEHGMDAAELIFMPGLSTAAAVSDISGRGVGLDAVRHELALRGGTITVRSSPGQGTCFEILLPMTLAVMDGMIVNIGEERYAVPLGDIQEAFDPAQTEAATEGNRDILLADRDLLLGRQLQMQAQPPCERPAMLVIRQANQRIGLTVDQILGQQKIVVRPVETGGAGKLNATILGDGTVALILTAAKIAAAARPRVTA